MALSADSERLLMHAACADSYHDFSHPPKGFGNTFNPVRVQTPKKPGLFDVCIGLPATIATQNIPLSRLPGNQYNPDVLHKENQMLQELFKGQTIGEGAFETKYTVPNALEEDKKFVKNLCKAIAASRIDASKGEEHKASCNFDTLIGSQSYTIKLLSDSTGEVNINEIQSLQENKRKGREGRPSKIKISDLFRFFGNNEVNLVFDACSMNVTSLFKNALPGGEQVMNVNWLINREFLNDPATKPICNDPKVVLVAPNQMKFRFLVEADPNPITYSRYEGKDEQDVLQRDKFFSLLDFKLGPLQFRDSDAHPNTRLEVFQNGNSNIYFSDSPNIQNQIGECCASIWAAITGTSNNHIETAAHYQRKRSGDWLQALSCLDTGRLYFDRDGTDKSPFSLKNKNIILVTHDRILLWYGLMHGLDVLFAGGKGLEEVEGGEEDESEDEAESSGSTGPKLYLLYFSNNKRTQSKEQIDKANLVAAETLLPKLDKLRADVATFNTNLKEIEIERNKNIELKFNEITELADKDGKPIKGRPLKIIDLLKEFIRYSSLDYNEVKIADFDRVANEFIRLKDSTNVAQYEKKMSAALLFISSFTSLRSRMDTLSDKDSIKTSDNFARDSAIFRDTALPSLIEAFDYEIRGRSSPQLLERKANVKKVITQLAMLISGTLSVDNLRRLRTYLDGTTWDPLAQVYNPKSEEFVCINDILVKNGKDVAGSNLQIVTSSLLAKLLDVALAKPAEEILKVAIESIIENSVDVDVVPSLEARAGVVEPPMPAFNQEIFEAKVAAVGGDVENLKSVEVDKREKAETEKEIKNQIKLQEYSRKLAIADAAKLAYDNAVVALEHNKTLLNMDDLRKLQKKMVARRTANNIQKITTYTSVRNEIPRLEEDVSVKDQLYKTALDEAEAVKPFIFAKPQPPPRRSIRLRISNFFNVGPTLRSWANKALRFFTGGKGGSQQGGVRGDQEFWAFLLVISYINELVTAINGFDDVRNLDYKYFEGLSIVIISYLRDASQKPDMIKMAQFLYKDFPNSDWAERDDFSRFVVNAGHYISLKAVDQSRGSIPSISVQSSNLLIDNSVTVAYDSNIRLFRSYKKFADRKLQIVKKLGAYVSRLAVAYFPSQPLTTEVPNLAPVPSTKVNVPRFTAPIGSRLKQFSRPNNTRVLVSPVGGRKTRRSGLMKVNKSKKLNKRVNRITRSVNKKNKKA